MSSRQSFLMCHFYNLCQLLAYTAFAAAPENLVAEGLALRAESSLSPNAQYAIQTTFDTHLLRLLPANPT